MRDERRDRTGGENRKSEESNEELKSQRYKPGKEKKKKKMVYIIQEGSRKALMPSWGKTLIKT